MGMAAAVTSAPPSVPVTNGEASNIVPNSYIVKYKATPGNDAALRAQQAVAEATTARLVHARGGGDGLLPEPPRVGYYNVSGFVGLHVEGDDAAAAVAALAADPAVEYVEADTYAATTGVVVTQDPASPGLVRLSHARLAGHTDYVYDAAAGDGITAYVVDTGINIHHPDFGGRAEYGYNAVFEDVSVLFFSTSRLLLSFPFPPSPPFISLPFTDMAPPQNDPDDDNGHGSHIAGIVGGATFGVAKRARLVAVKVFDFRGTGPWSQIMRGMQWAADDAAARGRRGRAVLNLSLGGEYSDAVNALVQAIADVGIVVVAAAGNENVLCPGPFTPCVSEITSYYPPPLPPPFFFIASICFPVDAENRPSQGPR